MSLPGDATAEPLDSEVLLVVLAAASHAARRLGLRQPLVTQVRRAPTGPSVWALAGRLEAAAAGRRLRRQIHSSR